MVAYFSHQTCTHQPSAAAESSRHLPPTALSPLQKLERDMREEFSWVQQLSRDLARAPHDPLLARSLQTLYENPGHFENRLLALRAEPEQSLRLWQLMSELEIQLHRFRATCA